MCFELRKCSSTILMISYPLLDTQGICSIALCFGMLQVQLKDLKSEEFPEVSLYVFTVFSILVQSIFWISEKMSFSFTKFRNASFNKWTQGKKGEDRQQEASLSQEGEGGEIGSLAASRFNRPLLSDEKKIHTGKCDIFVTSRSLPFSSARRRVEGGTFGRTYAWLGVPGHPGIS